MAIDRPLSTAPVGLFDSGVGGLSVWREVRQQWPAESTIYFADQAHIPYGPRPPTEILRYAEAITVHLLDLGCKAIVVACNAASAAALYALRARFPQTPFIGMEPAVKPAAKATQSRVVGVLATPGTLAGALFAQTAQRYAADVRLINQPCPGLVEQIEAGRLESPDTEALLRDLLAPMLDAGADRIVLACTHYPFVAPLIARIAGAGVTIIDPAPAVARQLGRVLETRTLANDGRGCPRHRFLSSGEPAHLETAIEQLLGLHFPAQALPWTSELRLSTS